MQGKEGHLRGTTTSRSDDIYLFPSREKLPDVPYAYPGLNIDESQEEHSSRIRNLKVCRGWRWISSRAVPRRMGTCIYSSDIKSTGNGKGVFDDWAANCFSPPRFLGPFLCFSSLFITIEHDFEESNHGFKFRLYKSVLHPNISREALSWQHGLTLFLSYPREIWSAFMVMRRGPVLVPGLKLNLKKWGFCAETALKNSKLALVQLWEWLVRFVSRSLAQTAKTVAVRDLMGVLKRD